MKEKQAIEDDLRPMGAEASRGIVFALAPDIRHYFDKVFDPRRFASLPCHWLDVSHLDAKQWEDALMKLQPTMLVTGWGTPPLPESYAGMDALSLRYVCHLAGGVKPMVPRRLIERGVLVSNWGESISFTIAEHAILLVLGLLRNLPEWGGFIDKWQSGNSGHPLMALSTRCLRGKRVGLHGFGAIAREIVQMLRAFRVEVSAYSDGVPTNLFEKHQVKPAESLAVLFSGNDIVIECEAVTSRSRGSVTERLLRLMPDQAIFVNVGRMAVVDEVALIKVVQEGRLRVGTDVYQHEPISPQYPLLKTTHALLSPHIAGPTEDALPGMCEFALANLQRYIKGEPIEGLVSLEVYDRTT